VITTVKEKSVTAEILSYCETAKHLEEIGFGNVHARILLKNILEVRDLGVPLSSVADTPLLLPVPATAPGPHLTVAPTTDAAQEVSVDNLYIFSVKSPAPTAPTVSREVNRSGVPVRLGTGNGANNYYCGRVLGVALIPNSDGQCGASDGPQCMDCRGLTRASPPNAQTVGRRLTVCTSLRAL